MTTAEPDRDPNHANRAVVAEFRSNAGHVGGYFAETPLLLLTTTGAKTGIPRTRPLAYLVDNDRYVVVAANAGAPGHPDWFHNLVSDPEVVLEIGGTTSTATAVVLRGAQRQALLVKFERTYPVVANYRARARRKVPVVALYPNQQLPPAPSASPSPG